MTVPMIHASSLRTRVAIRPSPMLAITLLAVALLVMLAGCSKPEAVVAEARPTIAGELISFPAKQDPATLRITTVSAAADHPVALPGRLAWDEDHTSRVYAPYAGRIERLLATVGQRVQRGQALAVLSSADIGQAQADLHKAEADQALNRGSLARVRDLVEGGVVARKDLDQAEADLARSTAEANRARARLAQYGVAASAVTQSLTLTAPLDGLVVDRNSNPGAEVRTDIAGAALFTISDPVTLWATLDLDESQLALLHPGQAIELVSAAWPGQTFKAQVLNIGAAVDAASRTVKVRARVANPEGRLKAEMFVTAQVSASGGLPLVPVDAVFLRGEQSAVFVPLGGGRFERRRVEVRAAGPQWLQVVSGLAAGDSVVVGGALYLNQLLDAAK
jgi:cobalt-zinc-cadmium efflux system membrane fusion protein